jgi:dienelactone hydrolase
MPRRFRLLLLVLAAAVVLGASPLRADPPGFTRHELVYGPDGKDRRVVLYEPGRPPKGLIVFLPGTNADAVNPVSLAYMTALARRGYAVATVDYDNRFVDRFDCEVLAAKGRQIFDRSSPRSALNRIYARSAAEPDAGLGVIGFSQGGWIGHQAGRFTGDVEVRAALLLATGRTVRLNNRLFSLSLPCNERRHNEVPRVLAVNGESDPVYTFEGDVPRAAQLREPLAAVTGVECDGRRCMDGPDGSGWILVGDGEVTDGLADHEFPLVEELDALDPIWYLSDAPWALKSTVDWLEAALRP